MCLCAHLCIIMISLDKYILVQYVQYAAQNKWKALKRYSTLLSILIVPLMCFIHDLTTSMHITCMMTYWQVTHNHSIINSMPDFSCRRAYTLYRKILWTICSAFRFQTLHHGATWAHASCHMVEEYWYCSGTETQTLGGDSGWEQWWPSCMPLLGGDGVAEERLQCEEVWWTNLAESGREYGVPWWWSKPSSCKEHNWEAQGRRYV